MRHSGRKSQRRPSAILPASIRSFFFFAAAMARSISGWPPYLGRVGQQMIIDPAREDRGFHGYAPRLRKSLHPAVQIASRGSDLAFLQDLPAGILDAIAPRNASNGVPRPSRVSRS